MGRKVYVSKTIRVGSTDIEVKQPIFKGKDGVTKLVHDVTLEARGILEEALRQCDPSGPMRDVKAGLIKGGALGPFEKIFLQPPTTALLQDIWRVLAVIHARLNAPFAIKVYTQGNSSTMGYVNKYYPISRMFTHINSAGVKKTRRSFGHLRIGRCSCNDGIILRDIFGSALTGRGDIHVSLETLNSPEGALTLIHEAGHKFASLGDVSYMYDLEYEDNINAAGALKNADSYAWFACAAANAGKVAAEREKQRAVKAADDGLDGVGALFG
jgi:hypothetical protein